MDLKTQEQYEKLVLTPIKVIIPKLAIPTIISMMVSMIYNLVDAYFVGKIGTAAAAAVGILMSGNLSGNWLYVWPWFWFEYFSSFRTGACS